MQRREMAHLVLTTASHDCILEARLEEDASCASCASYACNFSCFYQSV